MLNRPFSPSKLQALLVERGLTATGLAKRCGWVRSTGPAAGQGTPVIANWLKELKTPNATYLRVLAAELGVPLDALLEDEKNIENISPGT